MPSVPSRRPDRAARILSLVLLLVVAGPGPLPLATAQEQRRVPKEGTAELVVTGCLKGRVLTVMRNPSETGAVLVGADVVGRTFRLAGPRTVMADVKKYDRQFVEVVGLVRTSDLRGRRGVTVGGTKVTVGAAPGMMDPNRPSLHQSPVADVVVMDATSVRLVSGTCPVPR